jgi:hypothetical protein
MLCTRLNPVTGTLSAGVTVPSCSSAWRLLRVTNAPVPPSAVSSPIEKVEETPVTSTLLTLLTVTSLVRTLIPTPDSVVLASAAREGVPLEAVRRLLVSTVLAFAKV